MTDWKEIFDFVVELAFRETGRAMLWMLVCGVVGLLVGVGLMIVIWRFVGKMGFFDKDAWGRWGMRILLIFLGFSMLPVLATNAGFYGLILAAEKTVVEEQLVEKAAEESFGLGFGTFWQQLRDAESGEREEGASSSEAEEMINLTEAREFADEHKEMIYQALQNHFLEDHEETFGKVPGWLRGVVEKMVTKWLDSTDIGKLFDGIYAVMDQAEERKGSALVSPGDLAWSVGSLYLKPEVLRLGASFRKTVLVGAVVQVAVLILAHLVIGGLVIYLVRMVSGSRQRSLPLSEGGE